MRKNRVKRTCETCGTVFERPASNVARPGSGRFCSRPCHRKPVAELFWRYVVKSTTPDGCWGWTGATDKGYGRLWSFALKRSTPASRVSWEIHNGPIPPGMDVCHRCDNPPCTRPDHLFLGERSVNVRDMLDKKRHGRARLSTEDVLAIRARAATGEQIRSIAKDYPSCYSAVRRAARGEAWAHVATASVL